MLLNLGILADRLEGRFSVEFEGEKYSALDLGRPKLYYKGCPLTPNSFYVASAAELPVRYRGISCIVLCPTKRRGDVLQRQNTIVIHDDISLAELFNAVQDIFDTFDAWDEELTRILHGTGSLADAINTGQNVFGNPVSLMNSDFRMIHIAGINDLMRVAPPPDDAGYLPRETVDSFKIDPRYNEVKNAVDPFFFPDDIVPWRTLCVNFFREGEFSARLIVSEVDRTLTEADTALLGHMAPYVEQIYARHLESDFVPQQLGKTLYALLDGTARDTQASMREIADCGWKQNDTYICVRFRLSKQDMHNMTTRFTCRQIEGTYQGSCAFEYGGGIVVAMNLKVFGKKAEAFLSELAIFIREGFFTAGCSNSFEDISAFPDYHTQALVALDMGSRVDKTSWLFRFENYALEYLFLKGTSEMSATALCHQGLPVLQSIDLAGGSDYYLTLKNYLRNGRNASLTAREMFLHRLTLTYRLDRIKELTDIRWDTAESYLYLLASYYLLEGE